MAKGKKELLESAQVRGGSLKLYRIKGSQCGDYRVAGPGINKCYGTLYGARKGFKHHVETRR